MCVVQQHNMKNYWVTKNESPQRVAKLNSHSDKVLVRCWWNYRGVVHYDAIKSGDTINENNIVNSLENWTTSSSSLARIHRLLHESLFFRFSARHRTVSRSVLCLQFMILLVHLLCSCLPALAAHRHFIVAICSLVIWIRFLSASLVTLFLRLNPVSFFSSPVYTF